MLHSQQREIRGPYGNEKRDVLVRDNMLLFLLCVCATGVLGVAGQEDFLVGVGIADITGPAAGINMMGYANPAQRTAGIHLRLYSRAFIFSNPDGSNPVVFVSFDTCMSTQAIKFEVMDRLRELYGDLYTDENVLLSATHQHSGPAAYHQYVLYEVTSFGFFNMSLQAIVTGIVRSITIAHDRQQPARLFLNQGELYNANVNRSPSAYENNPPEERARYLHNVDKEMVLLKITDLEGGDMGMINWFPVHPVSMNNTNHLISSDNKGYASVLFEADFNSGFPGEGSFVAAFAQSNQGDVSPNTSGPRCLDTGEPCDILASTCSDGHVQLCVGFGPGADMFESTKIIAERHYDKATELYNSAATVVSGNVDYRLKYVNMTNQEVYINETYTATTCKPALGYSFAAGTTDGAGAFNFTQGIVEGNDFWNTIRDFILEPSEEMEECHKPKPVLLPTGEAMLPYAWQPDILDYQILRIGQLVLVGVPGEYSTMAGRRTRESIYKILTENGFPEDTKVVIAGLANSYSNYIVTFEEYQIQRYEGASTCYGPHTLRAGMNVLEELALAMATGQTVPKGDPPPNLLDEQISFIPEHDLDTTPDGMGFGDVLDDVMPSYLQGERVSVTFVAGHPINDLQLEGTFLTVETLEGDTWQVVYRDSSWYTRFYWDREGLLSTESNATITWDVPDWQAPGLYRIQHFGHSKNRLGDVTPYTGTSSTFEVLSSKRLKKYFL